jgi:hypothetical protein
MLKQFSKTMGDVAHHIAVWDWRSRGHYEPLRDAEALLVLTACPEFAVPDYKEMRSRMRGRLIMAREAHHLGKT